MRRCQARALDRPGDHRLLGGQLRDLGVVQRAVQPQLEPADRRDGDFGLQSLADGPTDIGRELDRIGRTVGLNLDVAPVDIVCGKVRGQPSFQPAPLQADLIVGEIVRARAGGNDEILRVDSADAAGP